MAVTPGNLALGPGTLYIGAFGVAEPADSAVDSAPGAGWTDVGATLGGISLSISQEFKELECDQLTMAAESRKTKEEVTLTVKLGEVTLDNLVYALTDGTVTDDTGFSYYEPAVSDSSNAPTYRALLFDGYGAGGARRRVIVRKVLNTSNVKIDSTKDDQQGYECEFKAHWVSAAIKPYKIIQSSAS